MDRQIELEEVRQKAAIAAGRPAPPVNYPTLDAGVLLGAVDTGHDHTHLQLLTDVDNQRSTVDLTPYMERRARRYWRYVFNDWVERRLDELSADDLPDELLPK